MAEVSRFLAALEMTEKHERGIMTQRQKRLGEDFTKGGEQQPHPGKGHSGFATGVDDKELRWYSGVR
jgi:hypothetical protein